MTSPDELERHLTLRSAVERFDELREREALADDPDGEDTGSPVRPLRLAESLELLALGEVIARKAYDSRLIGLRAALRGGAGWDQIARALDRSPAQAWETYLELVDEGLDGADADAARELAGARPRR